MAENLTTLGIEISTVGIKAASKAMDELSGSAKKVEIQVEKTESTISQMEMAEKALVPQTQKVKKELDGVTNSAKRADVELDKTKVSVIDLNRAEAALVTQTDKVSNELDELSQSAGRASTATSNADKNLKKIGDSSNVVKGKFGAMKGATQNVSYQLQDIAVQAQMGTSAFIILGQQGPQLASIFGPGGAVLGAFIAFGSMLAGVLYNSIGTADTALSDLDDTLAGVTSSMKKTKDGTLELSREIYELAKASQVGALAKLSSLMFDSKRIIAATSREIGVLSVATLDNGATVSQLNREFKALAASGATVESMTKKTTDAYIGGSTEMANLSQQLDHLSKKYGMSRTQSLSFLQSVSELKPNDFASMMGLNNVLAEVAATGRGGTAAFYELQNQIADAAATAKGANDTLIALAATRRILRTSGAPGLDPLVEGAEEEQKREAAKTAAAALAAKRDEDRNAARLVAQKAAAQSRLDSIMLAGTTEYEAIKLIEDAKQAKLAEDRANELISATEFEAAKTEIEKTATADRLAYRLAAEQMAYQTAGAFAGKITALMAGAFGEQSAAAKAAYVVQQGLAIAQTIVATEMAAITAGAQASVLTGVAGFLGSASMVKAMGYASVAIIAGQTIGSIAGGRALGGQVRGGESYLVGERGPELLTMGTSGRIATNENLKNAVGGGGGVTVINNIDATGSGPDVETKIKAAMDQTSAKTIATIQDLMRRRRFA